jgi:antimicrobial peptide system SdpA family protein
MSSPDGDAGPGPAASPPHDVKTRQRVGVVAALVAFIAVLVVNIELPSHPTGATEQHRNLLRVFIPEGWSFFTLSPRKSLPEPMRLRDGHWESAAAGPNAAVADGFGVDRIRRAQGTEIALILAAAPRDAWTTCDHDMIECLSAVSVTYPAVDAAARPSLCGDIGLVDQQPLPWAWRRAERSTVMPSKVIRMEVRC